MLAQIFEFRHGHTDIPGAGAIVKNSNQSLRLRKWQRLEKDCPNEREDGDVATNSERQSQHAHNEEPKTCTRESAGGATAQVVAERRLLQPLYPLALGHDSGLL